MDDSIFGTTEFDDFNLYFSDHVSSEMDLSKALNRLGEAAMMREDVEDYGSNDIGAAFQKFSVVTKELSNLMKNLVSSNDNNNP